MNSVYRILKLGLTLALLSLSLLQAQQNPPHIGYIFPAGGQRGSHFKVTIGGQFLDAVSQVLVSGDGFSAVVVEQFKPLNPKEANLLRDELQKLREKKQSGEKAAFSAEDEKRMEEIRKKLAGYQPRPANPSIVENVTLDVTLSADARPGARELRLITKAGLTNPMVFQVGELPEYTSREANSAKSVTDATITIPTVVNGQIMPGGVDRYRFTGRKGQQIVVAVFARALIPYLADAVPGWFQATLALLDSKGKELVYDDDYNLSPDPVLSFKIPEDGDYFIQIKDSLYRGREDFVYRIIAGELPFITGIFPLGQQEGNAQPISLSGWNLPTKQMTPSRLKPGIHQLTTRNGDLLPHQVLFKVDTLPECMEVEPNDSSNKAQPLMLPVIVNGHVGKPGDWDIFSLQGKAGQELVAEVYARRLDSPLDSVLKLTDASGKQLAFNDDHVDKGSGLNTHHADSYLSATLPVDGTYFVHLGDTQRKGGDNYSYRLRLSAPRPNFELRVAPSSINIRAGASIPLTVYALREDGLSGEVTLSLLDSPPGFVLGGARIPVKQDQIRLTLTAPMTAAPGITNLSIVGYAETQGRKLSRVAVPAEDMMQAFAYRHLVPSKALLADVVGRSFGKTSLRVLSAMPVRLPAGGTKTVHVSVPTNIPRGKIKLQLSDAPEGITLQSVREAATGSDLVLACDAAKIRPGVAGNLIVQVFLERDPEGKDAKAKGPRTQTVPLDFLPAISFEVIAPGATP